MSAAGGMSAGGVTRAMLANVAAEIERVALELVSGRGRELSEHDLAAAGYFILGVLHGPVAAAVLAPPDGAAEA